jgi:DNA-binding transcriptional MerR regulator
MERIMRRDVNKDVLLRVNEVAELLRVTRKTVGQYHRANILPEPSDTSPKGQRKWRLSDVDVARRILRSRNAA